jgi:hypothetical protein
VQIIDCIQGAPADLSVRGRSSLESVVTVGLRKGPRPKRLIRRVFFGIFLFSIIIAIGYYSWHGAVALWQTTFTPKSITISYKHLYSESLQKQIESFARHEIDENSLASFSPGDFYKKLKQYFKIVRRVDWDTNSPEGALLTIEGVRPLAVVNEHFVVGNKRRLFPSSFFQLVDLQDIKRIEVGKRFYSEKLSLEVYEFVQKIPNYILSRYTVSYEGKHRVILKDNLSKWSRCIIADQKNLLDGKKLMEVDRIEGDYLQVRRERGFLRTPKSITYDVRFKNRIYATTRQREVV